MPPPPVIANRYVVQRSLGRGGQGEVYAVEDTHEGDVVALKLLSSVHHGGPWLEARILRGLSDPHILPIRNADVDSGQPYLVTELAPNGDLEHALRQAGPHGMEIETAVRMIRQACYGIARAHAVDLLHNDIKLGNLFLNEEMECMVGDFGFAALLPPGATTTTPPGATPETAAPEIAAGWPTLSPIASVHSDVYSLGACAYWLLTGVPPYDFINAPDTDSRMALVASQAPARVRDVAPHVPAFVASTIEKAMSRTPGDRFESVTALAAELGRRPVVVRAWRRTDEHPAHIGCWRGETATASSDYVTCLEPGSTPARGVITTKVLPSGRRVIAGCRDEFALRSWAQKVRGVFQTLA